MSYRTLTYRGQCIQGRINAQTGEEEYTVHNSCSGPFKSLTAAQAEVRKMLFIY